jgi:hypothetical protein
MKIMALQMDFENGICGSYKVFGLTESQKKWVFNGFYTAIVKDGL